MVIEIPERDLPASCTEIEWDDVAGPLSLQGAVVEFDTPADLRHSGNSVYACLATSGLSIGC